ncbi:hypothetical protein WA026_008759 [Henosepilachna vigintioctopunctata]|uniref:Transmembrane protein 199 n=1 Tax=Henosepilachna vigintioctopunctata TaxID=420089 RepID=A0AAW1VDA8_9CUCU
MTTYKGPISDPTIRIKPSQVLYKYISSIKVNLDNIPEGLCSILTTNKKQNSSNFNIKPKYLLTAKDYVALHSLENHSSEKSPKGAYKLQKMKAVDITLKIEDLRWLYEYIVEENIKNEKKVYLHELMENSELLLPENMEIPRNPELEKRCKQLRIQLENQKYQNMTKNIDNARKRLPEDTIGYQIKEMNKQLIAVFQFVISVVVGFTFGFIGIEVFVGSLDFGFKLLLGIIFALIVALAELYFLAKKLNEEYNIEPPVHIAKTKVD